MVTDNAVGVLMEVDRFAQLSPKHQRVVRYIAENPSVAAFATASDLGERIGVSTATVVRLAQTLGFTGYPEFQQNIRHGYYRTLQPLEVLQRQPSDRDNPFQVQIYQDVENLRRMSETLHLDTLERIARRIQRSSQIVIISSGTHSSVALVLGAHLRFMGYPTLVEDRGGPHLTAAIAPLGKNDLVIAITFWKGVREIVRTVEWATSRNIQTIGITDTIYSPLAKVVGESLTLPTEGTSFFQSLVAPLSLINALLAYLAQHADETRREIMKEAERSYELLGCFADQGSPRSF
jgi:DNA-binding MurR/RpiR family transcriptional regulator